MGYNTTGSNSFWENSGVSPQRYSTSLYPTVEDWSWQQDPPSLNGLPNSTLEFGTVDPWLYNTNDLDGVIVVNSTLPGQFIMGLSTYNLNQNGQSINLLTTTRSNSSIVTYNTATFDMGFDGFGVPALVYHNILNAFELED